MEKPAPTIRRDWHSHPPLIHPPYKSSVTRGPTKPLVPIAASLAQMTGPVYGHDALSELDHDLTRNAAKTGDAQGERMIVNYLDPELPADAQWLAAGWRSDCSAVLADTRWPEGAELALNRARTAGLPAVLDADKPVPSDARLLHAATHVAFSADGLADYAGHRDYEAALLDVAAHTEAWCCVTLGGEGVLFARAGETHSLPAFQVQAVDSLGAGDIWHGALTLKLAEGEGEDGAMLFASAAAALKVQRKGGRAGVPSRGEVEEFISEHSGLGGSP